MTAPDPAPMVSRSDASALMPEQVNPTMVARSAEDRRKAGTRACVGADGKVMVGGTRHVGYVSKTKGMAWRARDRKGNLIGLHGSKLEAAGALVLRHEGGQ